MTKIIDYYNCPNCKQVLEIDNSKRPHYQCSLMKGSEKADCNIKCTLRDAGECVISQRWISERSKQQAKEGG